MEAWFDVGVNMPDKRLDPETTLQHALEKGVHHMLLIGTSYPHSAEAAKLAEQYPINMLSTAGVHPHNAKDVSSHFIDELRHLAANPKVVAIGECGLDFNRNFSPADQQLSVFEQQLQLACEIQLPVYLHERDAFEQQFALLEKYRKDLPAAIVHCFTGNLEQMQAYASLGCYFGITGWVCDPKRGEDLRTALPHISIDKLLLETDAPYLKPKTLKTKSRNNEPATIPHIAQFVAELLDVDVQYLKHHCWRNTLSVLNLEPDFASE